MASGHARKSSGRGLMPRRTTKGPLDAPDDPLSIVTASTSLSSRPADTASQHRNPSPTDLTSPGSLTTGVEVQQPGKDLSFILAPSVYHPLSQLDVPSQFRVQLPTLSIEHSLSECLDRLKNSLAEGHFLSAAHLSALILTSDKIRPIDIQAIFYLLQIRYSCLELTGNTMLAAQEAKALEDLNSAFYFTSTEIETPIDGERMEEHIMPYSLRLQALHLQSIGFGDPRRGVSSLYDLGLECREHIGLPSTTKEDRDMWRERLQDLGIRIVNALVEMGDFDTAKRTLLSQLPTDGQDVNTLTRLTLLLLKIGDIATARRLLETHAAESNNMLQALLAVSEGRWEEAVQLWKTMLAKPGKTDEHIIVKQNLAVALLYTGRLPEARKMLEDLVDSGRGFQSLTFNLATIYELSTTNAHASKRGLAARVAKQPGNVGQNWGRNNVDFKL